jgi:DNA-3-methyladenine glycosylase
MQHIDPVKLKNVEDGARYLLGCKIVRTLDGGQILSGMIVETEGYHQTDPASHTYRGQTPRNIAMFGPPAHAYVYFTYGMHWCFNVTAGVKGEGSGILIRAIEPLEGIEVMQQNRKLKGKNLTNGPGKLAQALMIDKALYGHDLHRQPLQVVEYKQIPRSQIIETTRVGIKQGVDTLWRFYIAGNAHVSKY